MRQEMLVPTFQAPASASNPESVFKPIVLMDETSLSNFAQMLKDRESELLEDKDRHEATLRELAEGYGDDIERNVAESKDRAEFFRARVIRELPKVQTALLRVMNDLKGSARNPKLVPFGKCQQPECGNDIERGRLEAVPYEPTCMAHKECGCAGDGKPHRN